MQCTLTNYNGLKELNIPASERELNYLRMSYRYMKFHEFHVASHLVIREEHTANEWNTLNAKLRYK